MQIRLLWIVLVIALAAPGWAWADSVTGRVASIISGDSFILTAHRKKHKIKLADVSAPGRGQPYADSARQLLTQLIFAKTVTVRLVDRDRYGRSLGWVEAAGLDINRRLIELGAAWVSRQGELNKPLLALEKQARWIRAGVWGLPESEQVPPWLWSRQRQLDMQRGARCGGKRFCTQMASCREARHYLNQCGLVQLDNDRNGIPCEGLCQR